MSKLGKIRSAVLAALMIGAFVSFAGCEDKGPAEKAGKSIDKRPRTRKTP